MFDKKLLIATSLVLLWTCFDIKRSFVKITPKGNTTILSDELSKLKTSKKSLVVIKIYYCYSCGYRSKFEQFSEIIRTKYPSMTIIGKNHSPPFIRGLLAKILSFIKISLLISLLFGLNPFPFLRILTPRIYLWALQNKLYACLMIFLFSNTVESYLTSTGAFEILINHIPVWSKLETGRLPTTNEFLEMIQPFTDQT